MNQTLQEVKDRIVAHIQADSLTLNSDLNLPDKLSQFIAALPLQQFVIPAPQLTSDVDSFTITGQPSISLPAQGLPNSFKFASLALKFSQSAPNQPIDTQLTLGGSVGIGNVTLPVQGQLAENNTIHFALAAPTSSSFPLTSIGNMVGGPRVAGYLPTQITEFASIPITALMLDVSYSSPRQTVITVVSDVASAGWEFISGFNAVRNLQLTLASVRLVAPPKAPVTTWIGSISGTLHIGLDRILKSPFIFGRVMNGYLRYNLSMAISCQDLPILPVSLAVPTRRTAFKLVSPH